MEIKLTVALLPLLSGVLLLAGCAGTEKPREERKTSGQASEESKASSEFQLPPHHFIEAGMSTDRVTSLVGPPEKKVRKSNHPDVWHYRFGLVLVQEGQVRYKFPPSRSGADERDRSLEKGS